MGSSLSSLGASMLATAIGWDLYERTHSAYLLGLVGLVMFIPVVVLALPVGHIVDRHDRRQVLMGAMAVQTLAAAGLAVASFAHLPVGWYYALLFLAGISQAFQGPSRSALAPTIVPADQLVTSLTWGTTASQFAFLVGPALAGLVIAMTRGASGIYAFDAVVAGLFSVLLLGVVAPPRPPEAKKVPTLSDVLAGLRFVWSTELMIVAVTLDMFAVLLGGATTLLPIFAKDILAVGPTGLGWLMAAPSVGAALTSLTLSALPPIRRNGPVLLWTVMGFGAATIGFALAKNPFVAWGMLFLVGAFDTVSMIIRINLSALLTPDSMRGRVEAVNRIFIGTSNELGGFESGLTASWWGPVRSVLFGGIGTLVVVSLVALRSPKLRRLHHIEPHSETQA